MADTRLTRDCDLCEADDVRWQWDIDPFDHPSPWARHEQISMASPLVLCEPCRTGLVTSRIDRVAEHVLAARGRTLADDSIASAAEVIEQVQDLLWELRQRWNEVEAPVSSDGPLLIVGTFARVVDDTPNETSAVGEDGWRMDKPADDLQP
jgi:hypothetical protein